MKKIFILILIFNLIFFVGCKKKITDNKPPNSLNDNSIQIDENSIPFIVFSYNDNEESMEAYLNYWSLSKGKIIKTNKIQYSIKGSPNLIGSEKIPDWKAWVEFCGPPLSWDGETYIYLSELLHEVKNPININYYYLMFPDSRREPNIAYLYSKGLRVEVELKNYLEEKYTEFNFITIIPDKASGRKIKISLYKEPFHGGIPAAQAYIYNETKKEIKALHLYFDDYWGGHFLICKINLENLTYEWHEVSNIKGCIPFMNGKDISIIDDNFYVPLCGNYIGKINSNDYSFEVEIDENELLNFLSFYNISASQISYPFPRIIGEFRDFLILNINIGRSEELPNPSENWKHIYMAYDTKTKKVKGFIEWNSIEPEFLILRDENGVELSKIRVDELIKNIIKVPCLEGNLLENGDFIYSRFILFPHKNGD